MFLRKNRDIIAGLLVSVFGLVYLIMTTQIPVKNIKTWSSAAFPRIYGILLSFIGLLIIIKAWREKRQEKAECSEGTSECTNDGYSGMFLRVIISFLILIVCITSMQTLGFVICSFLYMFLHFVFLGKQGVRQYLCDAVLALLVSVVIWLTFTRGFGLLLPSGRLF